METNVILNKTASYVKPFLTMFYKDYNGSEEEAIDAAKFALGIYASGYFSNDTNDFLIEIKELFDKVMEEIDLRNGFKPWSYVYPRIKSCVEKVEEVYSDNLYNDKMLTTAMHYWTIGVEKPNVLYPN